MHGITNSSYSGLIASGTSIARYAGLLLGGRTVLDGITNNSLRVDTRITGYAELLLDGHTILSGIAISSPSVDCFENLYRPVCRVTARCAYDHWLEVRNWATQGRCAMCIYSI